MLELSPAEQVNENLNISYLTPKYLPMPYSLENVKCKPRGKPPPYHCNPNGAGSKKAFVVTSVFAYIDKHPDVSQGHITKHVKTHPGT
jgi:hypothetical protein